MTSNSPSPARVLDLFRWLSELAAIVVLGVWGFSEFAWPLPALATGLGAVVAGLAVWALFLSPRSVIAVDPFGRALAQIVLVTSAALAMVFMAWPWWSPIALVLVATLTGIVTGRRGLR